MFHALSHEKKHQQIFVSLLLNKYIGFVCLFFWCDREPWWTKEKKKKNNQIILSHGKMEVSLQKNGAR